MRNIFNDRMSSEEFNANFYANHNNKAKEKAGIERRKGGTNTQKRVDYSNKGDHKYYVIGANHKKCSKCGIIVDILFDTPWYMPRDGERQWIEPPCTWKGRSLPKEEGE